jgi:preprotein translocase subunit YajC
MINMLNILLMAPSSPEGGNPIMSFLPIILIGIVFYFFMIRPQTKKVKDQKSYIDNIKKGDKIVTIGGIHGKIAEVNDDSFILEIENGVRMKIEKSSVSLDMSKKLENK